MLLDSTVDVVMGTHRVGMSQYLLDHLDGCMRGVRSADGPMHQGHMGMSQYHLCTTAFLVHTAPGVLTRACVNQKIQGTPPAKVATQAETGM